MGPKPRPGSEPPSVRDFIAASLDYRLVATNGRTKSDGVVEWKARYEMADRIIRECRNAPPASPPGDNDDTGGGR